MGAMQRMHKACQFVNRRLISAELLRGSHSDIASQFLVFS
jgi:hypothetical protein